MSLGTYEYTSEQSLFREKQRPVVVKKRPAYLFSGSKQAYSSPVPILARRARKPLPPEYIPEPGMYGKSRMPVQLMSASASTADGPRHIAWRRRPTLPHVPEPGQHKRVVIQILNHYRNAEAPALARRKQTPTELPEHGDHRVPIAHFTNLRHILPPIHARMHPRTRHTPEHEPQPGDYRKPDPQLHQHHPDSFGAILSRFTRESPEHIPEPGDRRVVQFHFQHISHLHSESFMRRRPTPDSLFPDPEPGDYRIPIIGTQTSGGTLTAILGALRDKRDISLPIEVEIDLGDHKRVQVFSFSLTPDAINAICIGQITVVPAISFGKVTVGPAIEVGQITVVPAISTGKITSEC